MCTEESPLINKISQDLGPQITEITTISYFIANNKTYNSHKLNSILPKYVVDKKINFIF